MRQLTEDRLTDLALINRAFAGGDGYSELQRELKSAAALYSDPS